MKQAYVIISSIVFAFAAAVFVGVNASPAAAAGGGLAKQCGGGRISLDAKEYETYRLHNQMRRDRGLPAFCVDPKLTRAAEAHSRDMMQRGYFSHVTKGSGTTFDQRLKRAGYGYKTAGENIAWGSGPYATPSNRMAAWMKSDGHRVNILNRKFREIGIAAVSGTYRQYEGATMWTADFGTR